MMKLHEYPEIGEKLYSTVLPNGLEIRVIPKKDFSTCYAAFMTNYGGAHRRFTIDGRTVARRRRALPRTQDVRPAER